MPLSRTTLVCGVALFTLSLVSDARAGTSLQGLATVTGGWTDNAASTPIATADYFLDVRPGLRLTSNFDRALFYVGYTFDATLYLHGVGGSGYSNTAEAGVRALTSKTTVLQLVAGFAQSNLNNVQILQPSTATVPVITPLGTTEFYSARAAETFIWDIDPHWTFRQTSAFNANILVGQLGDSYTLDNLLTLSRTWGHDAGIADLRIAYIDYPGGVDQNGQSIAPQQQLIESLRPRWLHDFGAYWSTELALGVMMSMNASNGSGLVVQPTARAAVHFRHDYGGVDLSYDHDAQVNGLFPQTFLVDAALLRGTLPLGRRTHLSISASGGYSHGTVYDSTLGALTASYDVWTADATLGYAPWPEASFFARYSFADQLGSSSGGVSIPGFMRNVVMVGVTVMYPTRSAAPYGFRDSVRADKTDMLMMVEPHSQPTPDSPSTAAPSAATPGAASGAAPGATPVSQ